MHGAVREREVHHAAILREGWDGGADRHQDELVVDDHPLRTAQAERPAIGDRGEHARTGRAMAGDG